MAHIIMRQNAETRELYDMTEKLRMEYAEVREELEDHQKLEEIEMPNLKSQTEERRLNWDRMSELSQENAESKATIGVLRIRVANADAKINNLLQTIEMLSTSYSEQGKELARLMKQIDNMIDNALTRHSGDLIAEAEEIIVG